ncbi:DUF4426 domain-containing protein [Marinihelvus fidelis]|uniref:DUF4426 domain-containing protein n=1 Tax=Marinihelvus fidelis TaxID=2613842 RepID=A0A5N0T5Y3_9GAMM|nr:DUF4426 domain-containing protein [Marinihelvus fidelis]KAA9129557.1 DUF4426 domain-containing protein [Marinihelvus fidelis]
MKAFATLLLALFSVCAASQALAQQSVTADGYTIHYNALGTSQLTPQVAQVYGIQRSSSRALLNITVLNADDEPIEAKVTAHARNLTGQQREIDTRKISEGDDAIYYIGEFRVNNMETFDFTVKVVPEGASRPVEVKFRQQFYTE